MTTAGSPAVLRCAFAHADAERWGAAIPRRQTAGAAGLDLHACLQRPVTLAPGAAAPARVGTGLCLEIPPGHAGLVVPRSSAARSGLRLANTVGVIDADYRGEVLLLVTLDPAAPAKLTISPGDRIAQLLVVPVPALEIVAVPLAALTPTGRGAGGFGSTGG